MKTRVLWGFFTSFILAVAIGYFWGDRNPDWVGYIRIYDNGGAWLSESGRDSVFLFLVEVFRTQPIVPTSYESFRVALALVFVFFSFQFMSGSVLFFPSSYSVFVLLPFLSLAFIRSTVQVREGLAIVLFLFAFKTLFLPKSQRIRIRIFRILLSGSLFFLSAGTHLAGFIAFVILVFSLATTKLSKRLSTAIGFVFTPLVLLLIFFFAFQFGMFDSGVLFAESFSGDRNSAEGGISFPEGVVWAIFIFLNIVIWLATFFPTADGARETAVLQVFARNLAGPAAVSGGMAVLILKATFVSPVVTVLIVRTAEFCSVFSALLIAALYGKRYSAIVLAAFLLLKTFTQLSAAGF